VRPIKARPYYVLDAAHRERGKRTKEVHARASDNIQRARAAYETSKERIEDSKKLMHSPRR